MVVAHPPGGPPVDRRAWCHGVIRAYAETFREHRAVTLALAEARTFEEVRAMWAGVVERWAQSCAAAVEVERARGAAAPGLPARDLAVVVNLMNEALLGVWLRTVYGRPPPTVRRPAEPHA